MDEDIRLEKCIETIYDQIIELVPQGKRRTCPVVIKMATMLDSMKHENNKRIAIELGVVGDCEGCGSGCKSKA